MFRFLKNMTLFFKEAPLSRAVLLEVSSYRGVSLARRCTQHMVAYFCYNKTYNNAISVVPEGPGLIGLPAGRNQEQ